jgi:hypothetical protein
VPTRVVEYDRLARAFLEAVDWPLLCRIASLGVLPPPLGSEP